MKFRNALGWSQTADGIQFLRFDPHKIELTRGEGD